MRRECKGQPKHPGQLGAEAARPQQCNRHFASLSGNRFHYLSRLLRPQVCPQFLEQRGKIVPALPQIPSQRSHCLKISPRSAAQPQIDSPRVQRFQRPKLFRHYQRRMVRQHHSTAAHSNRLRRCRHMPNQHRRGRASQSRNCMMFCQPIALVSQRALRAAPGPPTGQLRSPRAHLLACPPDPVLKRLTQVAWPIR